MQKFELSYAKGETSTPLITLTIGDAFDQTVALYPDNDALVVAHQNIRYSYKELQKQVDICARALMGLKLEKGDRVGVWSLNNAEWVILQLATAKVGLILVSINPAYRSHELKYTLTHSGCKAIFIATPFKSSNYVQTLHSLEPSEIPDLQHSIYFGEDKQSGMINWSDFLALSQNVTPETLQTQQKSLDCFDAINIQYTSGTTGFPKGATLSHHNILNNAYFVGQVMNFSHNERLLIPVPLYHCFGMVLGVLTAISHAAAMLFPSLGFNPKETLQMIQDERATALHGVPTMFIAQLEELEHQEYDLQSLRTGVIAGAPCSVELMKQINTKLHMSEVEIAAGMTEVSPINTQTTVDAPFDKRIGSVGQVHPHVEIKIIDKESQETLKVNEVGEICTRGYSVMLGYWRDEEKTKESIDEEGWMHSGDLAFMDEDGYVHIVGRIKDMIIRGGENIYPREIEEFFYTHPKVSDVAVIGVPDKKFGEEIMVWVKPKEHQTLTAEELRAFAKEKIAYFKVPKYFKIVESFPMTVTGKIQKFIMKEESIKELNL